MIRDKRYGPIKVAIEGGLIKEFQQLYDYIPKSVIAKDIGANNARIDKLKANPEILTFEEVFTLSECIQIDYQKVGELVYRQVKKKPTNS